MRKSWEERTHRHIKAHYEKCLKKTDKRNDATRTKELEEAGRTDSHFVISLVKKKKKCVLKC